MHSRTAINGFLIKKLKALRQLSKLLGFSGKFRTGNDYNFALGFAALIAICDPDIGTIQRAYLRSLLEICLGDDWEQFLPGELVGYALDRGSADVIAWKKSVMKRDGKKCTECGSKKRLHVHHIIDWAECPELRIEIDNGVTLCEICHSLKHPSISGFIKAANGKE